MAKKPLFDWDPDGGRAACILSDGENVFVGIAVCDSEDMDMMSEKTGCQIALWRAEIKYYTHLKNNEIKPALAALKQYYYSINKSKKFNPKSYEYKMLKRQIQQKENDLILVKDMLAEKKQILKEYLEEKQKFYNHIRANRAKGQKSSN